MIGGDFAEFFVETVRANRLDHRIGMLMAGEPTKNGADEIAAAAALEETHKLFIPRRRSVDVPHVRQNFNWDCGLACVLMVLRTVGVAHCDIHELEKLCSTTSIWTVDLAYLLHRFSVRFSFFTVTLGVNPDFSAQAFYKEQLQDDIERVDRLFEQALECGISIQHRSFSGREISVLILSGEYIVIALLDKIKLSQTWLKEMCVSKCYGENSDYTGHYIVICGYDACTEEFEVRDPASARKCERVSLQLLDESRKSFGTDEDLLLVSLRGEDELGLFASVLLPEFGKSSV